MRKSAFFSKISGLFSWGWEIHDRDDFDGNLLVSRGNFWKIRQNRFEARQIGGRRDFLREFVPEFSENIR